MDIEIAGVEGVVSNNRSCPDSQHFFLSLPTTLQHPLFLEFWNPLGMTGSKVGWEKQKHKKVTKKRPRILGSPWTHSRRRRRRTRRRHTEGWTHLTG